MVLTSEIFWNQIMTDLPETFGPQNPHNEEIKKIQEMNFGFNKCN